MSLVAKLVLVAGLVMPVLFTFAWRRIERANVAAGLPPATQPPTGDWLAIGFVANFFDTLGIGSFATTTAYVKFRNLVRDEHLPGTLNVGHALPTIAQAIIFTTAIAVAPLTLISMVAAAVAGGYFGTGIVSKLPRRSIQLGMGIALLIAAAIFVMKVTGVMPPDGNALGLTGGVLVFAIVVNFLLGALMQLGIGLYAPCLTPVSSLKFIRQRKYDKRLGIGLAVGGIPGVLLAAFVVKSLPMQWLYWLVVVVVLYAAILMLRSALQPQPAPDAVVSDAVQKPIR
ncbi:MAG: TSUP family transporter [Proteobacteria bacterium]|nr:TSUP family transporter [Pseudomonadota bacterium]